MSLNREKIRKFVKELMDEKRWNVNDLIHELETYFSQESSKHRLKEVITPWLNFNKNNYKELPEVEVLFAITKLFGIKLDELINAKKESNEDKRLTIRDAVYSNDLVIIDKLFSLPNNVAYMKDEYQKGLVDYMMETKNLKLFEFLLKKKYIKKHRSIYLFKDDHIRIDRFLEILIKEGKHDFIFKNISRFYGFKMEEKGKEAKKNDAFYYLSDDTFRAIRKSEELLNFFTSPFVPLKEELTYNFSDTSIPEKFKDISYLPYEYSSILEYCIEKKKWDIVEALIYKGLEYNEFILDLIYEAKLNLEDVKREGEFLFPSKGSKYKIHIAHIKQEYFLKHKFTDSAIQEMAQNLNNSLNSLKTENYKNNYYIVVAACGHVGLNNCILIPFTIRALTSDEAKEKAFLIPRVKRNRLDSIIDVFSVNYEDYKKQIKLNNLDPYLKITNSYEQTIESGLQERIIDMDKLHEVYKREDLDLFKNIEIEEE